MRRSVTCIGVVLLVVLIGGHRQTSVFAASVMYGAIMDNAQQSVSDMGLLAIIDPVTGIVTPVGKFGTIINGLAYDPDQDILYGTNGVSTPLSDLFQINRQTGVATRIGSTGERFWGIAYDPTSRQLFAVTDGDPDPSLYTINPATGQATLIGSLGLPSGGIATRGLALDPVRDILFLGTEGDSDDGRDFDGLSIVDTITGQATYIGAYKGDGPADAFNNVRGLEFDQLQNRLLGINGGAPDQLLTINTSTGIATVLINLSIGSDFRHFHAFVIVEEPLPVIQIRATPETLWPPNGKLVPVTITGTVMDIGSGVNPSTVAYVVTDEYQQVQPKGSVALREDGSYSFTIQLQASRNGNDRDGRQYTITVSAQDYAGNKGSAPTGVIVPHD